MAQFKLQTIKSFDRSYTPGQGATANCTLECGHTTTIRVGRGKHIVPGQTRARCYNCVTQYDYFLVTAEYQDDQREQFVLRQPVWNMRPGKGNWKVEPITQAEYENFLSRLKGREDEKAIAQND